MTDRPKHSLAMPSSPGDMDKWSHSPTFSHCACAFEPGTDNLMQPCAYHAGVEPEPHFHDFSLTRFQAFALTHQQPTRAGDYIMALQNELAGFAGEPINGEVTCPHCGGVFVSAAPPQPVTGEPDLPADDEIEQVIRAFQWVARHSSRASNRIWAEGCIKRWNEYRAALGKGESDG